ncbi:MAG: radical SAM protein [Syntrophobacterales bacterium]|jgi:radical SAM superfamily enzyme|nr:radical SAM protein [Syntrophobacterales bacterium]
MYEQGVIRPPSEASSLLLRVTRNCPWNQCVFCPAYKGTKFSKRTVAEVKKDIDSMAVDYKGYGEQIQSAFLQDGDSLLLPTAQVLEILLYLKEKFPNIKRITTYARAPTLRKKGVEELVQLREAGLTRIHAGLESGSAKVLKIIKKGITPEDIVEGGRKVVEAGISLSEYIMPGVGGYTLSEEHARETARLLNLVRPDFIRVRTFALHPQSPLNKMVEEGAFIPMSDDAMVAEIRLLVSSLDEMHSYFSCGDYSPNLLMQVDGYLYEKKAYMLQELDSFLALTAEQRQAYSLLRRTSYMNYPIDVVLNEATMRQIRPEIEKLEKSGKDGFNKYIQRLMSFQIPQPQTDNWK